MRGHPKGREARFNPERSPMQRDVLPMPDRPYEGPITYDAKDPETSFPTIEPLRPPAGAPNVLVILLDDVGFGASSAFGATPVSDDHSYDNAFTGRVRWVQIDIDEAAEDLDHLLSPEELLRVAMAKQ